MVLVFLGCCRPSPTAEVWWLPCALGYTSNTESRAQGKREGRLTWWCRDSGRRTDAGDASNPAISRASAAGRGTLGRRPKPMKPRWALVFRARLLNSWSIFCVRAARSSQYYGLLTNAGNRGQSEVAVDPWKMLEVTCCQTKACRQYLHLRRISVQPDRDHGNSSGCLVH